MKAISPGGPVGPVAPCNNIEFDCNITSMGGGLFIIKFDVFGSPIMIVGIVRLFYRARGFGDEVTSNKNEFVPTFCPAGKVVELGSITTHSI